MAGAAMSEREQAAGGRHLVAAVELGDVSEAESAIEDERDLVSAVMDEDAYLVSGDLRDVQRSVMETVRQLIAERDRARRYFFASNQRFANINERREQAEAKLTAVRSACDTDVWRGADLARDVLAILEDGPTGDGETSG